MKRLCRYGGWRPRLALYECWARRLEDRVERLSLSWQRALNTYSAGEGWSELESSAAIPARLPPLSCSIPTPRHNNQNKAGCKSGRRQEGLPWGEIMTGAAAG